MSNILVGTIRLSKNVPNIIASYIIYNSNDNTIISMPKINLIDSLKRGKKIQGIKLNELDELETTITSIYEYLTIFLDKFEVYDNPVVIISEQSNKTYNVFGYLFKEKINDKLLNNYGVYNTTFEELLNQKIVNGTILNNRIVPLVETEPFQFIELEFTNNKGAATNIMLSEISPELKLTNEGDIYLSKTDVTKDTNLEELYIPSGVRGIRARGFQKSLYTTVLISGTTCEKIGVKAFSEMKNLKNIELNIGLKIIGTLAFEGCEKLESIQIPHTVEIIEATAFDKCKALKEIIVHRNLDISQNSAFIASYNKIIKYA